MNDQNLTSVRELLLARRGVAFVAPGEETPPENRVQAVELELAEIGYVLSSRLRNRLSQRPLLELVAFRAWARDTLLKHLGGDQKHVPLFRRFPDGVPENTLELWWTKVLVHFLQADNQPCLFCDGVGTTHVMSPCEHVVCDHCFDGSNYSACPVCGHHVDPSSPFFKEAPVRGLPKEKVVFQRIDLADDEEAETRKLFVSLCVRKQALSPDDRDALIVILKEHQAKVFDWLPESIPLRENVAIVFGTLLKEMSADEVMPQARRYMTTATDVLRFIAVLSGTDGSLQRETVFKTVEEVCGPSRFWGHIAKLIGAIPPGPRQHVKTIPLRVKRFKVAKLPRPLRRALLAMLDEMRPEALTEDMLRHRSYWVWVGEFLHPAEYAKRYPSVAEAFRFVRKKGPDGTPAPQFRGWYSRVEQAFAQRDVERVLALLSERPGELARRFDFALRIANGDPVATERVVQTFLEYVPSLATPVLLTLKSHLPARLEKAPVRIYWPKGRIAKGVSTDDQRVVLSREAVDPPVCAIDAELLRRFAEKPRYADCVIDDQLRQVTVPFNERTASSSAVALPRGSRVPVAIEKTVRLFLHWCQPPGGQATDLDLSVGIFDPSWKYLGVCSYYELTLKHNSKLVAKSAGDLLDAPWPDGATEFVDLHCGHAAAMGARYAVMVVNSYAGLPFSLLERAWAGFMVRDDIHGKHFDPRTVELKFELDGENGVFLPLVLDLHEGVIHWLDVQSKGQFQMNNVETSKSAIQKICPELMTYFASGTRPFLYDLALMHAAARCDRVVVRGSDPQQFVRQPNEDAEAFYRRLLAGASDDPADPVAADGPPVLAILHRGDIDLPDESCTYTIFRERVTPTIAAADLLS